MCIPVTLSIRTGQHVKPILKPPAWYLDSRELEQSGAAARFALAPRLSGLHWWTYPPGSGSRALYRVSQQVERSSVCRQPVRSAAFLDKEGRAAFAMLSRSADLSTSKSPCSLDHQLACPGLTLNLIHCTRKRFCWELNSSDLQQRLADDVE